jgi:amino acid adenylation domain-containing protein
LTAAELGTRLESLGIVLTAEGGRLRVNAPRGSLTEQLKTAIAESRDELLALVERRQAGSAPGSERIERIERGPVLPISNFQERMWIHQRMAPTSTDFNIVCVWNSATQFVAERQCAAVRSLIQRHEILHSAFDETSGVIGMRLLRPESVEIERVDLSATPAARHPELVQNELQRAVSRPFDLISGPAVRFVVCELNDSRAVTLCIAHHIAVDAWSLSLLEKEFAASCASGVSSPAPLLQYADYAAWQRARQNHSALAADLKWWSGYLAGAPQLSVFAPDLTGSAVSGGATYQFDWDAELAAGLRALARAESATIYSALLAACAVVLSWHTGQHDFVIGGPTGARERSELETMVGPFVGLLLFRIDVADDPKFTQVLRRARDSTLEAHAHRHVSFETLLEHLKPRRMADHSPLYQMAIVQHNTPGSEERLSFSGGTMHELTWFIREAKGGLQCALEFRSDRYSNAFIARVAGHLETVLRRAVEKPDRRLSDLMQLSAPERHEVTRSFNNTQFDVPSGSLATHFARRAAATPDAIAITFQDTALSYAELNRRANALAHRLSGMGLGRGARVALCLERSLELVAAMLAVHKTGAAYVPLDPGFPSERLSFMLEDSGAVALVTDAAERLALHKDLKVVRLDQGAGLAEGGGENPAPASESDDPAYVIYTSGSTGRPKGVIVSQGSLMNFLWSMTRAPGLTSTDVLAAVTTVAFDIAGLELYLPLLVGGRIELVPREVAADGAALARRLSQCGATVLQATPATWRLLVETDWRPPRSFRALCGGETMPHDLAGALLDRVDELWNLYGPTETTIWSTVERIQRGDRPITVGRPIGNTQVYIVGASGEPLPIGVTGEIWIGGAGVALGYHNRPDLTGGRFISDPFSSNRDARLYRTGDLGRWQEGGRMEHLGRIDHQVKVRGFRVELGEIEARLSAHEAVRQCVVLAPEAAAGDVRLVAYVVYQRGQDLTVSEVRSYLRRDLPDYMIPSVVVSLDSIPLTANGKVDRAALPDPFKHSGTARREHAALSTPMEELIGGFWRDLLKVEGVGAEDNFFDLGGHSLLTLRVAAALEERTGWRMDPRTHYFQNLRQIAASVGGPVHSNRS